MLSFCIALDKSFFWLIEPLDDVTSFLITIGSPALAAYSLQITHLNRGWITTSFLDVRYPNSRRISTVLSAFHHVPIRVSPRAPLLHSLLVLPKNDEFWCHLAAANETRRWSIPLVVSYVLVIFSVILTIMDSITSPPPGDTGYSTAAIWTPLLPLIIGWLSIGCEPGPGHLRNSLDTANQKVWVATERRDKPAKGSLVIEFAKAGDVDLARKDELKPVPIFNYSRAFTTPLNAELILGLMKNAATNAEQRIPVANVMGRIVPVWVEGEGNEISDENRVGTDTEVTEYCTRILPQLGLNSSSTSPLGIQSPEMASSNNTLLPLHNARLDRNSSRWAPGIWKRVAIATALALGLQWGTAGAAVMIHYTAPPVGLGCRALSFMLYGAAGTLSFLFFLASSILAHMSRPLQGRRRVHSRLHTCQNAGAIICRWLGKFIAMVSAMGILLVCFFQITGAFNSCFCSSITFDKGEHPVVILAINYVVSSNILRIWIGGLAFAFSTALLFGFSMYLGRPPSR